MDPVLAASLFAVTLFLGMLLLLYTRRMIRHLFCGSFYVVERGTENRCFVFI
jgi:hypothetical protein